MHRARLVLALLFSGALLIVPAAQSASSNMVVSQVYAGGGNSGATYANDFVELFNRGASAIDISSWSRRASSSSCSSRPPLRSVPPFPHRTRPARRTSRTPAERSRSSVARPRSRVAHLREVAPQTPALPI
jgi:hypothetical protein